MAPQSTPSPSRRDSTSEAAWQSVGYLVAGVIVYGALGWLADRWLGTSFLVAVGVLVGAGLGLYLTWVRQRTPADPPPGQRDEK